MSVVPDSWTAVVETDLALFHGLEFFYASGKCVVESKHGDVFESTEDKGRSGGLSTVRSFAEFRIADFGFRIDCVRKRSLRSATVKLKSAIRNPQSEILRSVSNLPVGVPTLLFLRDLHSFGCRSNFANVCESNSIDAPGNLATASGRTVNSNSKSSPP